jgi:hypothetical protein
MGRSIPKNHTYPLWGSIWGAGSTGPENPVVVPVGSGTGVEELPDLKNGSYPLWGPDTSSTQYGAVSGAFRIPARTVLGRALPCPSGFPASEGFFPPVLSVGMRVSACRPAAGGWRRGSTRYDLDRTGSGQARRAGTGSTMDRREFQRMQARRRKRARLHSAFRRGTRADVRHLGDAGPGLSDPTGGAITAAAWEARPSVAATAPGHRAPLGRDQRSRNKGRNRTLCDATGRWLDVAPLASEVPAAGAEHRDACRSRKLAVGGDVPGMVARDTRGKAPKRTGCAPSRRPAAPRIGARSGGADSKRARWVRTRRAHAAPPKISRVETTDQAGRPWVQPPARVDRAGARVGHPIPRVAEGRQRRARAARVVGNPQSAVKTHSLTWTPKRAKLTDRS